MDVSDLPGVANGAESDDMEFDSEPQVGEKRDISGGDGGVFKEVITPGSGWERPEKGDKVTVHYVGTLESDGSEFDSSRGRGDPFTFTLGEGQVIKGWDVGVATMKKGEISKFTIRADYGYGDSGSPPKIPGGAVLVFEVELLHWHSVKDIAGDGGVIKTVIHEGEGWATPKDADEATVEIVGKVVGAAEDAPPFFQTPPGGRSFTVKDGFLCKAVATAVKTMKKGEHAKLVVSPAYGFQEEENTTGDAFFMPEGVPSKDVSLELDVTLIEWKKVENVTPDGGVIKKVLKDTTEWQRPNAGAKVKVSYAARRADGTVFDERSEDDPLEFTTEEEQAPCEGLELAVMQMKKGERALVTVAPNYAFGGAGVPEGSPAAPKAAVPGGATVTYEVVLIDMVKAKETWDMSVDEKLEAAEAAKKKGTDAWKAGNVEKAVKFWERAKQAVEYDDGFDTENRRMAREFKRSCELNLAAAHLKSGRPLDARKSADKVLEADSFHLKALYRRAQSYIETGDWVEAAQDIKKALGVEPGNTDFKLLARKLKVAESAAAKKEAALWAGTFAKMAKAAGKRPVDEEEEDTDRKKTPVEAVAAEA